MLTMPLGVSLHTWPVTACAGMSIGLKGALAATDVLIRTRSTCSPTTSYAPTRAPTSNAAAATTATSPRSHPNSAIRSISPTG
jgi:aminobenzoyl-glutamate utilization protein B